MAIVAVRLINYFGGWFPDRFNFPFEALESRLYPASSDRMAPLEVEVAENDAHYTVARI